MKGTETKRQEYEVKFGQSIEQISGYFTSPPEQRSAFVFLWLTNSLWII